MGAAFLGQALYAPIYAARQQSKIQQQMIEAQSIRDKNRTKRKAMSEEIERIKKSRQVFDANIKKSLASGFTMSGTMGDIMDSNMDLVDEDLAMIKANKKMAIGDINQSAQNAKASAKFQGKMNEIKATTDTLMTIGSLIL